MTDRDSRLFRAMVGISWLIDKIAVSSVKNTPQGWHAASEEMSAILSSAEEYASAHAADKTISYLRHPFSERTGVYQLERANVLSFRPPSAMPDLASGARQVSVLNQHLRPVSMGLPRAYVVPILKNAAPALMSHRVEVGRAALLGGYYSDCDNYFHYWVDVVADIYFLERMGFARTEFDVYLMPFSRVAWQEEILQICGIDKTKVVAFSSFTALRAKELFFAVRAKGGYLNPPWLVEGMRSMSGWHGSPSAGQKIYLSRRDAARRPITNEDEVIDIVRSFGFEVHSCSNLSVRQQQSLFASASHIVAPHGAALTNLAWCNAGATMIEFFPARHGNPCFHDLAAIAGVEYRALECPQDDSEKPLEAGYTVPLFELQEMLERISTP